jgi:hypothetical protein
MTTAKKPVSMCCVTIGGFEEFLMPADKGMKLVELLQHAVHCRRDYESHDYRYHVKDAPAVELRLVKPSQIVMPRAGHSQPALEGPRR